MMSKAIIAMLAGVLAFMENASAQDWPTRPVTMVVPFAAGGRPISWDASLRRAFPIFWVSR